MSSRGGCVMGCGTKNKIIIGLPVETAVQASEAAGTMDSLILE